MERALAAEQVVQQPADGLEAALGLPGCLVEDLQGGLGGAQPRLDLGVDHGHLLRAEGPGHRVHLLGEGLVVGYLGLGVAQGGGVGGHRLGNAA